MAMIGQTRGVDRGLVFDNTNAAPPKEKVNWVGILADALSGLAGNGPIYAPMMERRRAEQTEFERGEQQYQRQRADRREDAIWADEHRAPYRFESNDGSVLELGRDGMVRTVYKDPTPKMNFVPDGMGGGQWISPYGAPNAQPTAPVGKLTPVNGGPTATPSVGFPRF